MKKLVEGILDFRKNVLPGRKDIFAKLATGQNPDVLFVTCSDSRIAPNWFASTDPGDLFVVRNVGNLIPRYDGAGVACDHSVGAAIDFATQQLNVRDIIVCGHSGCGAMNALLNPQTVTTPSLNGWLRHAQPSLANLDVSFSEQKSLRRDDQLSQCNVLQQIENLKTYPGVLDRLQSGSLRVHAWWFEIGKGEIQMFDNKIRSYVPIDEKSVGSMLE